ncbi:hypothetical protein JD79_00582 [Geodermatophilus normandii]|uniref:DUF2550 family protein n=1 Tax=Geodermatophilus normandii TaxID=1137989 RepID=A0A317QEY2_9ACTN|nr:hypothetical protein [Geodermatophilus normandii]PWW21451.1 hypothetical protein JD79_00582 [Geodermatophilus normandii]
MLLAVVEIVLLLVVLGLLVTRLGAWSAARRAVAAPAHWTAAHVEVDGETRVLLRHWRPGADGSPVVLEDRVFATFPADDPAWEARFTEAMAGARFRCSYLDAEER